MPTRAIKVWNASASAWESVGIEAPDTSVYLTSVDADSTYLKQSVAEGTYLPISASSNFLPTSASSEFLLVSASQTTLNNLTVTGTLTASGAATTNTGFYHSIGDTETWYGTTASATSLPSASAFPGNTLLVVI